MRNVPNQLQVTETNTDASTLLSEEDLSNTLRLSIEDRGRAFSAGTGISTMTSAINEFSQSE